MKSFFTGVLTIAAFVACIASVNAQATIDVGEVDASGFPTISVQVTARSGGALVRSDDVNAYSIMEDGFEQSPLTVDCPTGNKRLVLSFIVGNGNGHTQPDVTNAGAIISTFVDDFDGVMDEGSISIYSYPVPTCVPRTSDKSVLNQKASSLTTIASPNYLHDILLSCASSTDSNGAVILFSTGQDNGSSGTSQDVTNLYLMRKIKLFLFHMGGGNPPQWLADLVHNTGGAISTELNDPANDILRMLRGTPEYCLVSYESNNVCRDGGDRTLKVDAEVNQAPASATKDFSLTADPATNETVTFSVQNATITSGQTGQVAVSIPQSLSGQRLYPGSFQLNFDPAKLQIVSATGENALASGSTFNVTSNGTGAMVSWTGTSNVTGTGNLFFVNFTGGATTQAETVPVAMENVTLSRGCLSVQTQGGDVELIPQSAGVTITTLNTLTFNWDSGLKRYDPEIQAIIATVKNTGDVPVTGLTATLNLPQELKFSAATGPDADISETSLDVDETTTIIWYVKPHLQNKEVTAQVQATVSSAEGATGAKIAYVNIKPATGGNRLACSADQVTVESGAYTPDPAQVRIMIFGIGAEGGPAGQCNIILPVGLQLAGGGTSQQYPQLNNGLSHQLSWLIDYPSNPDEQTYRIMFVTSGSEVVPDTCTLDFVVPGLTVADIDAPCIVAPNNIGYDETLQQYNPDPFEVSSVVRNKGTATTDTVWAELLLPAELTFAAGETERKIVSAGIPMQDSALVAWNVEVNLPDCQAYTATMTYRVIHMGVVVTECTRVVRIDARTNEAPVIVSQSPDPVGTVVVGVPFTFGITVDDADGDALRYIWRVAGTNVGADSTTSYTHTFQTVDPTYVTCTVIDFCNDSTFAFWNFTPVGVERTPLAVEGFSILGNYPNPFNPSTIIEYRVPDGAPHFRMELLDINGKLVKSLFDGMQPSGIHRFELQAEHLPSGTYIVRLSSGAASTTRTIMLVK